MEQKPTLINHSVTLDKNKCKGCTACLKRCPTEAIRIRDGKAKILQDLCIDCGECDKCDLDPNKFCDSCGKCIEPDKNYKIIKITKIIEK